MKKQIISLNLQNRGNQTHNDINLNISVNDILKPSQFITSSIDPGQSVSYELIIEELNVGYQTLKFGYQASNVSIDAYTNYDTLQWSTTLSNLEVDLPMKLDFEKEMIGSLLFKRISPLGNMLVFKITTI